MFFIFEFANNFNANNIMYVCMYVLCNNINKKTTAKEKQKAKLF